MVARRGDAKCIMIFKQYIRRGRDPIISLFFRVASTTIQSLPVGYYFQLPKTFPGELLHRFLFSPYATSDNSPYYGFLAKPIYNFRRCFLRVRYTLTDNNCVMNLYVWL